jgi:acyl carrier protein
VTTSDHRPATSAPADIKEMMRGFILETFIVANTERDIGDDDSFIDRHLVDSTGFLEIIMFLEDTWGIAVGDDEVIPENLDSLAGIERFVHRKLAGQ